MIDLGQMEITYKWSTRRRSIGIMVTATGELVVAAPRGASRAQIAQALTHHQAWIRAKLAERREAWEPLKKGRAFFLGRAYRLRLAPGTEPPVELGREELRVRAPGAGAGWWLRLQDWYRQEAARVLQERVGLLAARMNLSVGRLELRNWKRRWGECHPKGVLLRFNWRLIMLPLEIIDYVAAHELAHLRVPGHPREFWRQVEKVVPDYARRRRWLNRAGTPFLLWQPEI
jgi:predicted metal-dependent hydrolase